MAVYKDKDKNTYYVRCVNQTTGKQSTFRRNPNTGTNFKTKKEAKEWEMSYLNSKIDLNMTFAQLFEKYHQYSLLKNPVDDDLISLYKNHLSRFAKRKIASLKAQDLINFQIELNTKGKSPAYINKITSHFKTILNFGVTQGYLAVNNCKNVKTLKVPPKDEELIYWTFEQFKQVIQSLPNIFPPSRCLYVKRFLLFSYYTGMRVGEVRALKWSKIDFTKRLITIDHHICKKNYDKNGRKNNDKLILYMQDELYDLLKEIQSDYQKIEGFTKEAYVFPSYRGFNYALGANTPNRWMKKCAEYNDFPHIKYHGIRHSTASYYASMVGLTSYELSDRIGDTVDVVNRVYASFFSESKKLTAEKINQNSSKIE